MSRSITPQYPGTPTIEEIVRGTRRHPFPQLFEREQRQALKHYDYARHTNCPELPLLPTDLCVVEFPASVAAELVDFPGHLLYQVNPRDLGRRFRKPPGVTQWIFQATSSQDGGTGKLTFHGRFSEDWLDYHREIPVTVYRVSRPD